MLVTDFNYELPEELIAQHPLTDRAASRMLHVEQTTKKFTDRRFRDFPRLLRRCDLLVLNNTRVFPARLLGRRGLSMLQTYLVWQSCDSLRILGFGNGSDCGARPRGVP